MVFVGACDVGSWNDDEDVEFFWSIYLRYLTCLMEFWDQLCTDGVRICQANAGLFVDSAGLKTKIERCT